jgi:predicted phosphoribosyltransferase
MYFKDRIDAACQLAKALAQFRGTRPLVLAIPRGAVPMGRVIADALEGELDVMLVRKLPSPFSAEFAIGAIDESGWAYVARYAQETGADSAYIANVKREQLALLGQRRALYTPARAPVDAHGRVAIVVDDGLATGATMIAALHAVRAKHPARLICAVPVAAQQSLDAVRPFADQIVCLHAPLDFHAVSQFYQSFPQVSDAEVCAELEATHALSAKAGAT